MTPGKFIVFEGLNGCGKSTQVLLTYQNLCAMGSDVFKTSEPDQSLLGRRIREVLLTHKGDIEPLAELFLFSADRIQHIRDVIVPSVAAGKVVLCDRYYHSTIAYQAFAGELDLDVVDDIIDLSIDMVEPDMVFWIDTPINVCAHRMSQSNNYRDRIESKPPDYHQRAYEGYCQQYKHMDNIVRIDGCKDTEQVNCEIMDYLSAIL